MTKKREFFGSLLFRFRRLPGFVRRFKFWILIGLTLLLLLALGPWVGLLGQILSGIGRVLEPVVNNPVGRFIFVNLLLVLVVIVLYRRFKDRGRRLLGALALDRFLGGMMQLSAGRYAKAARLFEKVVRMSKWLNLEAAVDVYPEILGDARIKLALCYREMGEVEKAMKSLELLKVRDLSPSMKRDLAEAKAVVYSLSGELMDETIDREVAGALEHDAGNRRLLRLQRERAARAGDLAVAIQSQKRLIKATPGADKGEERTRLATLHARNALRLYRGGRIEDARAEISRSRASDPRLELPNLLAGDIAAERDSVRAAVKEWARTPSVPALERVSRLLEEGKLDGAGDLEFLVATFPRSGILLVLANHYLSRGKLRHARNCVTKFEDLGLANRHSALTMAEILRAEGDEAGANRLSWKALKGFLGVEGRESL
jgi:tetratricopeptide (TPR) repeat protein